MVKFIVSFISIVAVLVAGSPEKIENFSLSDYNGKTFEIADFKDQKAVILMFISTQCPVSNAYNERMVELYHDYTDKNIAVVGINSNKAESPEDIKEHASEHNFAFPILKDVNNIIADKLNANHTPEIFVINPVTLDVLYHGRIDDSQRESKISSKDLRSALDEIISGKAVSVRETKAFGCSIKRVKK